MANLIPPSAKKQVKIEYWARVISVWLLILGSALIIFIALYAPVYILVQNQLGVYELKFNEASGQNESFKVSETEVAEVNKIANLLAKDKEKTSFIELTNKLDSLSGAGVTINSFTYVRKADEDLTISVSGQATTRQSLVSFSEALEQDELFLSAEIPLANLAKDKDIPFTIKIVPTKGTK